MGEGRRDQGCDEQRKAGEGARESGSLGRRHAAGAGSLEANFPRKQARIQPRGKRGENSSQVIILMYTIIFISMTPLLLHPAPTTKPNAPSRSGADFQIGPVPDWVEFRPVPVLEAPHEDPIAMALIDRQLNLSSAESYMRTVKRMNNGQGVQHGSRVEITFDPSAESVTVHSVAVIRDGQKRELCHATAFRVLQREANLEQHVLDGHLSAMMFLEDVRVGDLIDVSYTLTETRTAFPGRFSTGQYVQFPIEVGAVHLAIRCEPGRALNSQCDDPRVASAVADREDGRVYSWTVEKPGRIRIPAGVPVWYSLAPVLWVSDFSSWGEVALMTTQAWGEAWTGEKPSEELAKQIEMFREEARSPEALADAVIRFVQNEIRYLSLEEGIGCFIPQHPAKVFGRRFGDCKDKSLLLAHLLNELGIPARPVLVSASSQHTVREMLPSPRAFDHVIVVFFIGQERHFVDPTVRDQGGDVRTRVVPQFGVGLIVDENTEDLVDMPPGRPDSGEMLIHEEFVFHQKSQPVDLMVTTMAKGLDADFLRQQLETVNREHLEREIEARYRNLYKGLSPAGGVEFHDDPMRNIVRIIHRFTIADLEPIVASDGRRVHHFPAHAVEGRLVGCNDHAREAPLAISFSNKVTQRITATFRKKPGVGKIENLSVDHESFRFSVSTHSEGNSAEATFTYENLKDHVPAQALPGYMDKLNQAFDMLGFNVPAGFAIGFNAATFRKAAMFAGVLLVVGFLVVTKGGKDPSVADSQKVPGEPEKTESPQRDLRGEAATRGGQPNGGSGEPDLRLPSIQGSLVPLDSGDGARKAPAIAPLGSKDPGKVTPETVSGDGGR